MLIRIANEMSAQSNWLVKPEQVSKIKEENEKMSVYAAQIGDVTILCWAHIGGTYHVKWICW